jgi:5-methylthioadenosine/S-adenosylhomocysteine deaminase
MGIPWRGTPSEKLPYVDFEDVLKMAAINGAKAMGLSDKVGSITPGKRADISLLDMLKLQWFGLLKLKMSTRLF